MNHATFNITLPSYIPVDTGAHWSERTRCGNVVSGLAVVQLQCFDWNPETRQLSPVRAFEDPILWREPWLR